MRQQKTNQIRAIIAGFGPFPGAPSNPSGRLATALAHRRRPALADIEITSHVFATAYAAVDLDLAKLLARNPDVVLIFGLADRRHHICIETRARNARSTLFPDVSGYRPERGAIELSQTRSRTGNAPFHQLLNVVRQNKLPARLSRDAGAYLCNYTYWRALQRVRNKRPLVQFVHIPWINAAPHRGTFKRRLPTLSRLLTAGESLLIALLAASRRARPRISGARRLSGFARSRGRSSCASSVARNARAARARSPRAAESGRSAPP
jgi:pyroglutamyl-peptidase